MVCPGTVRFNVFSSEYIFSFWGQAWRPPSGICGILTIVKGRACYGDQCPRGPAMIPQFLIVFREGFEALLLVSIVAAYLVKTGRRGLVRHAYAGGIAAVVASVLLGVGVYSVYTSLPFSPTLMEAVAAFVAVPVLTSVVVWMAREGRHLKKRLEERVDRALSQGGGGRLALVLGGLGFVLVFREGLETVLFLFPLTLSLGAYSTLVGLLGGLAAAGLLVYAINRLSLRLDLRRFFLTMSILIIFIASGILGYGVHEALEYIEEDRGLELEWATAKVYDLGIPKDSPMHEKGIIGSVLAVLFGYSTEMELARFLAQFSYLALGIVLVLRAYGVGPFKNK